MKSLEDWFFPKNGRLAINKEEKCAKACIVERPMEINGEVKIRPMECTFKGDGYININTEGLEYVTLNVGNLRNMLSLIYEADDYYNKI
jgi:hypothetical protein